MPRKDKASQLEYQREWYSHGRAYIDFIKSRCACVDCGYKGIALDFHHLDPANKKFNIAKGAGKSIQKIQDEMAKCVVLCSNCHIARHMVEGYKNK
jgi:5-methylcytosine-specific restriction endonuclease McrA